MILPARNPASRRWTAEALLARDGWRVRVPAAVADEFHDLADARPDLVDGGPRLGVCQRRQRGFRGDRLHPVRRDVEHRDLGALRQTHDIAQVMRLVLRQGNVLPCPQSLL